MIKVKGVKRANVEAVMLARLEGRTMAQIAGLVGISPKSVQTVLRDPDVIEEIEALRASRRERVLLALETSAMVAVKALVEGAQRTHESRVAVAAADSILDRVGVSKKTTVETKTSGVVATVTGDPDQWGEDRTEDDLLYYATHGHWPEEAPAAPKSELEAADAPSEDP